MIEIPLTKGKFAIIDKDDLELVMRYRWYYYKPRRGHNEYAIARDYTNGRPSGNMILLHSLLVNQAKGLEIDHKNGNGLDNRRHNLRPCNHDQNSFNSTKRTFDTSSKYKGVSRVRKTDKWKAQLMKGGKHYYFGQFNTEREAADAYDVGAIEHFGEYAKLNNQQVRLSVVWDIKKVS